MEAGAVFKYYKLALIIAALFLACPRAQSEIAGSFEEAKEIAETQEHAPATEDYFANTLMPYFSNKYSSVLQSCFETVEKPDSSAFSFVAAFGKDGRVVRVFGDYKTNIFQCMRATLETESFPLPPVAPYYLHIDMRFSNEDGKAPPLVTGSDKYSYTFGVPAKWDFSFEQAHEHGEILALFPKGESFDSSKGIVYVTEVCAANCGELEREIRRVIDDSRVDNPNLQVTNEKPLKITEGGEAKVRILTGAKDQRQAKEALAFIEHKEAIILVVLSSKDTSSWSEDYQALSEIVAGHKFFTCDSPNLAVACR